MQKKMADMTRRENTRRNRREINTRIDQSLKRAFDSVATEPVPDRFLTLLQQLRDSDDPSSDPKKGESND
jgi:hypothetical protein